MNQQQAMQKKNNEDGESSKDKELIDIIRGIVQGMGEDADKQDKKYKNVK